MSRALGDLQYKNPLNKTAASKQTDAQQVATQDPEAENDDFVTVEMSFKRIELSHARQYILALTSDGVTNVASDQQIMQTIGRDLNSGLSAGQVAQKMVDQTTVNPGSDNSTCIVVFVNGVKAPPC
ncbi:phosphatase 2C-like domain-containing protein [Aspergillus unguis]